MLRLELRRMRLEELVLSDEVLRTSPFIRSLPRPVAHQLLAQGIVRRYVPHAWVVKQAQPVHAMYLVLRGEARLVGGQDEHSVDIGLAHPGDVLGESPALQTGGGECYSAVAAAELDVAELPVASVAALCSAQPGLTRYLKSVVATRRAAISAMSDFLRRW